MPGTCRAGSMKPFDSALEQPLLTRDYPGNVRDLRRIGPLARLRCRRRRYVLR
jgi:DNA-binding NtrC family response regulator